MRNSSHEARLPKQLFGFLFIGSNTLSLKGSVATYFHSSNSNMLNCLMLATNIGQVKTNTGQNCHNGLIAFQGGQISLPSHGGSQL